MKLQFLLALLVSGVVAFTTVAQEKAKKVDPSGTWRFEYELEGQTMEDSLALQLGKDGAVTGSYKGRSDESIDVTGKIDGDQLLIDLELEVQGAPVKVKFDGKVKGDDIDGMVIATHPEGELEFDWIAKRSVSVEDVVGKWELEIDAVDTVLEPTVELTLEGKELKGTYKDPDSGIEVELTDIKIEKNELKFSLTADFQGAPLKANFSGRPYGNKVAGFIEYDLNGESGEVDFEGVRKVEKPAEPAKAAEPAK
jgi:hypothetical protein